MKSLLRCLVVVPACAGGLFTACPAPSDGDDEPIDGAGPALLFAPLPDAFRLPDDDVEPDTDGLQVLVRVTIENRTDELTSVTLVSAGGASDTADVVDAIDADDAGGPAGEVGAATADLVATLGVGLLEGAATELVATAGDLAVRRTVIGLDRRVPPPPTCELDVDVDGAATVTCSGGDPDRSAVQNLVRGGVVSLRSAPTDDSDAARVQVEELRGGTVTFPFAHADDGGYAFTATLIDAQRVIGESVIVTAVADVDVP